MTTTDDGFDEIGLQDELDEDITERVRRLRAEIEVLKEKRQLKTMHLEVLKARKLADNFRQKAMELEQRLREERQLKEALYADLHQASEALRIAKSKYTDLEAARVNWEKLNGENGEAYEETR